MSGRIRLPSFPDPVNEVAARLVAGGVAAVAALAVATDWHWLALPLAYGFVARALNGPRFSPWARLVTRVLVPRLAVAERPVPGTPKRFAQAIGAALTTVAAGAWLAAGTNLVSAGLLAAVVGAATLEAAFAFCIGCRLFAALVRLGWLPATVCEACADITRRPGVAPATSTAPTRTVSTAPAGGARGRVA
ncbi:MAG: DUF4395 domain-containing protein [Acidimicrobiia bacterium]|nr:DUF4395 domain-containing protein [Acidimicrobiia bacterium]